MNAEVLLARQPDVPAEMSLVHVAISSTLQSLFQQNFLGLPVSHAELRARHKTSIFAGPGPSLQCYAISN